MATFSERHGYKESRTLIQRENLDDATRMEIWNTLAVLPDAFGKFRGDSTEANLLESVWITHFGRARDEQPQNWQLWQKIKAAVLGASWWEVFDLLEFVVAGLDRYQGKQSGNVAGTIVEVFNQRFEKCLVGYRFVGHVLMPLDSAVEADAIGIGLEDASPVSGARHALERAVALLADRQNPDYPNSIKESVSAVESVIKKVTGEGTLGAGLAKLEQAGLKIHPALKGAWSKMYGWTSDADGIRHAGIDAADADQALAKYMLVTSSAFVTYLIEAARKSDLL